MCGVCGVVSFNGELDVALGQAHVAAMVGALAHRGPDDVGVAAAPAAVMGATRLAIRGLGDGRQPLVDETTGVVALCNGEIDNHAALRAWLETRGHVIRGASDVAVIPALYLEVGETFVEHLVGAFAIALWDPRHARLLLARDRAGERPLFYVATEDGVRFATEIAALAADPGFSLRPDAAALRGYLQRGSFTAPASPVEGVRKVAPAELVCLDAGGVRRRRYWRWPVGGVREARPSVARFDAILREAVRRQSDVEVPYGVFLSGGVDSSLVAAVARAVRPEQPPRAFTLRFGEPSYDEGSSAERVAERLGLESEAVWVTPDALPGELAELVANVGEPLADPAWVPTALLSRRAARAVKVALVGEGADELFGGYPTYIGALAAGRYARLPAGVRALARAAAHRWPPSDRKVSLSFLLKKFVEGAELGGLARHHLWTSNITPALLARLGVAAPELDARAWEEPWAAGEARAAGPRADGVEGAASAADSTTDGDAECALLDRVQRHDLETSLAEGLLTKADRASMQSALELRAPFLDRDVMAFAATLAPAERVRGLTTKVFLKRAALRYLPRDVVHRRKRGLSVPLSRWLREPLADWAVERLSAPRLAEAGVRPRAALALFDEHRARVADHARALWTLIVLSEWLAWVERRAGGACVPAATGRSAR